MASQFRQHILHDVAVEEVDDAVGVARVALRVGDHHDGGALLVELGEQVHHLLAVLGVEVAGGFVGEDELGVGDHGAAMATRCCCPPDNCCGKCLARWVMAIRFIIAVTRSLRSDALMFR